MPFPYDSTGIDTNRPEFALIPEGWYTFKIVEADEQKSKKGNDMVLCKCEVVGDETYKGVLVWHYVVFLPKGQKGDGINVHFRKCIGVPVGGNDVVDAYEWLGKKFKGKIAHEEYDGKTKHKIAEVSPLESTVGATEDEIPF
jgi:hypothetical protein